METLCEDRETEAAAWGTCCHQLSDQCLRADVAKFGDHNAIAFVGTTVKSGKFEFVVDEEMVNCAQEYIDHVRADSAGANSC